MKFFCIQKWSNRIIRVQIYSVYIYIYIYIYIYVYIYLFIYLFIFIQGQSQQSSSSQSSSSSSSSQQQPLISTDFFTQALSQIAGGTYARPSLSMGGTPQGPEEEVILVRL